MIRFATVGTGFITDKFIEDLKEVKGCTLQAVYSRTEERAKNLADKFAPGIALYTDLTALAQAPDIDAVYIASPNSLHGPQAKLFLQAGKHVLVEKAAVSNARELEEVLQLAKENNLVFMEAMKSLTMPAYLLLKETLPRIGQIRKFAMTYCQYSSRYDRHKKGEFVNTFQKEFSNGGLLDIGIYGVYPVLDLFGPPLAVKAVATLLPQGGIDGSGTVLFLYPHMEGSVAYSKISQSLVPSEIQGERGSLLIDRIGDPKELTLILRDGTREVLRPDTLPQDMSYEIQEFVSVITEGRPASSVNTWELALRVHQTLDSIRQQIGLTYPADEA